MPAQTREEKSGLESKFSTRSKPSIYKICFVWYLHRIYLKTKVPLVAKGSRCVFCNLLPKSKLRKEKREVQLLQHGEHGVQILQVNPLAIKLKVFNSDSWECSWLFLIKTIAWCPNSSSRVQPSWSVLFLVTHNRYVGTARRPTLGQAWKTAEAGLVRGLCCCLLQINWVVQATEQLDPAAQPCLTSPPHCSCSEAYHREQGLTHPWHNVPWAVHSYFWFSISMGGQKEIYIATSLVQEECCTLKKQRILIFWVLSLSVFHDLKFHSQRTSLKAFWTERHIKSPNGRQKINSVFPNATCEK